MSQYLRLYQNGGCYFFTLVTHERNKILTTPKNIGILREAFKSTRKKYPFKLDSIVVLPDHLHFIFTLPENDHNFSTRLRLIKKHFSHKINAATNFRQEKKVWQKRFWEHLIRNEEDFQNHVDYIHYNPVKHGYASHPLEWPFSSFLKFVGQGLYPPSWGVSPPKNLSKLRFE